MQVVYFKTDTSGPIEVVCTSDGRIDFSALGREFKLDPTSIQLNGVVCCKVELQSVSTWEQTEEYFRKDELPIGAEDDLVVVTSEAAVPTMSTDFEDCFGKWIKHMLLLPLTGLPQHEGDLVEVLSLGQPRKLPVLPLVFHTIRRKQPDVAKEYLMSADKSALPVLLTQLVIVSPDLDLIHSLQHLDAPSLWVRTSVIRGNFS